MDSMSSRPTGYFHKYIKGSNGKVCGIAHNSGADWQEQRRFALSTLRGFGFGKKSMDTIIHEETQLLIRSLLENSCDGDKTISISGQNLNVAVVNVLWQIIASKRFG